MLTFTKRYDKCMNSKSSRVSKNWSIQYIYLLCNICHCPLLVSLFVFFCNKHFDQAIGSHCSFLLDSIFASLFNSIFRSMIRLKNYVSLGFLGRKKQLVDREKLFYTPLFVQFFLQSFLVLVLILVSERAINVRTHCNLSKTLKNVVLGFKYNRQYEKGRLSLFISFSSIFLFFSLKSEKKVWNLEFELESVREP